LVDSLSWHWIFLINIPIGIFILLWGQRLLKAVQEHQTEQKLDPLGAVFLGLAMIALLLPLTLHSKWGLASVLSLSLFAVSLISFFAFVLRERGTDEPLIGIALLSRNPKFAYGNIAALLNYMGLYAVGLLTSVWMQLVHGLSAAQTGWLMLAPPVLQSILSPVAGRLSDRVGTRALTTAGMLLTASGMLMLAFFASRGGIVPIVVAMMVVAVGMASFSAPNSSSVMGAVARHQLGLAGAFMGTMRVVGMALSVAVLGGIAASRLGEGGWQALLKYGPGGPGAEAFIWGYGTAMIAGAVFALAGAFFCIAKAGEGA
jgi:MFS family permease